MLIYKTIILEDISILLDEYGIMVTPLACQLSSEDNDTDLHELIAEIDRIRACAEDVVIFDNYALYECKDGSYYVIQDNGMHTVIFQKGDEPHYEA
jgi:hypothetical protein